MKSIYMMNEKELANVVKRDLSINGIDDYEALGRELASGCLGENLTGKGKQAYIRLLKLELGKTARLTPIKAVSSHDLGMYLASLYADLDHEELHLISIDNAGNIIADDLLGSGNLSHSTASPTMALRRAIENNASGFFICHNHPSGKLIPSSADNKFTESLEAVARYIDIDFLDHFIVGNGDYLSMREEELM